MKVFSSFCILLVYLALGEAASALIHNFIPGNVLGMVLLFISLCAGLVKAEQVRPAANFLTSNMALFFVPLFMSILEQWGYLRIHLFGWLFIVFFTMVLVMLSSSGAVLGVKKLYE